MYLGVVDLAADEAYYWQWSRHMDWCYYSKGPLVASLIWLGTFLFGDTPFGIRFPTILLSAITLLFSLKLYQRLFPKDDRGILFMGLFYHTIPLMLVGSLLMTIDPPLCAAWTIGLWALHVAANDEKSYAWAVLAIALGCGILAKYTMLLFIPTIFVYLALSPRHRRWLKSPAPYLATLGGLLFFLPPIIWNATHNWVSFWHTAELGHFGRETHWLENLLNFPAMLLTQMGIISPIIFIMLAVGVWQHTKYAVKEKNDASALLVSSILPVFLLYTLVSFKRSINPNWLAAIYPAAILAGAQVWSRLFQQNRWRSLVYAGYTLGLVMCLFLVFSDILYIVGLPNAQKLDPAARLKSWEPFAQTAHESAQKLPAKEAFFYFGVRYQTASELAFYLPGQPKTYCASTSPLSNQYDVWGGSNRRLGDNAVLALRKKRKEDIILPEHVKNAFVRIVPHQTVPVTRFGTVIRWDATWLCYDFQGWTIKTELQQINEYTQTPK